MAMQALMSVFLEASRDLEVIVGMPEVPFEKRTHMMHHHALAQYELVGLKSRRPPAITDANAFQCGVGTMRVVDNIMLGMNQACHCETADDEY